MEFIRVTLANTSAVRVPIPSPYQSMPWTEGLTRSARLRVLNKSVNFELFDFRLKWFLIAIWLIDSVECCGSVIRIPLERRELTGAFSRLVPGEVISAGSNQFGSSPSATTNTTFGQNAEALDILPPSRVTDLRVHVEPTTQRVTFQWTAVGDDFDIGTGN